MVLELANVSEIAKTEPQVAYVALTSENKHKFSYFIWTMNCISNFMYFVEKKIREKLTPALFDGFPISGKIKKLLALPCKLGGMGMIDTTKNANKNGTTQENGKVNKQTWFNSKNIATQCQMKTSKITSLELRRNTETNTLTI